MAVERLAAHVYRQVTGEIALAKGRFIAMLLCVPGEDANLVEVVGKPILPGVQNGNILRNFFIWRGCFGIFDGGEHVGSDDLLAFGVPSDRVGLVDIKAAGKNPTGPAFAVARQPPVFQGWRWWSIGCRRRCRGLTYTAAPAFPGFAVAAFFEGGVAMGFGRFPHVDSGLGTEALTSNCSFSFSGSR